MAIKYHGRINLSRIDKALITKDKNGNSVIWCDILEKREPDQYGNTHTLTMYNKETRETIYLGDFKPQEFGGSGQVPQNQPEANDDLPWD